MGGIDGVRLVWLDPDRATLEYRMAHREGHYMNPNLLDSQIATLEPPVGEDVFRLAGGESADAAADRVLSWLNS
jgi:gluconokinase